MYRLIEQRMNKIQKETKKSHILDKSDVFVIAEIGKNFLQTAEDRPNSEYLENALKLIDEASKAGVDAVKLQTHILEDEHVNIDVTSPHFKGKDRVSWITRNMNATPVSFWKKVKAHAKKCGVIFFSTPMSRLAAKKLHAIGVDLWKVGSGDVLDYAMLDFLISTKKPIIFSTGMVSLSELDEIVVYMRTRHADFSILYCVSQYPAPKESFNLGTIELFKEKYPDIKIGFSDHSVGNHELTLSAVKMGAKIIEKHFSLSRDLWGSDHKVSMTPSEMKELVTLIRKGAYKKVDHKAYYGKKDRELEGAKNQFRPYFNKALVAGKNLKAGSVIKKADIYAMRPISFIKGLPANKFHEVVGKRIKRNLRKYDPITTDILS